MFKELIGKSVKVTLKNGTKYIGKYRSYIIVAEGEFLQVDDLNLPQGNNINPLDVKTIEEYKEEE